MKKKDNILIQKKENRLVELSLKKPLLTTDQIQNELRTEFGSGFRRTEILKKISSIREAPQKQNRKAYTPKKYRKHIVLWGSSFLPDYYYDIFEYEDIKTRIESVKGTKKSKLNKLRIEIKELLNEKRVNEKDYVKLNFNITENLKEAVEALKTKQDEDSFLHGLYFESTDMLDILTYIYSYLVIFNVDMKFGYVKQLITNISYMLDYDILQEV